MQLELWDRDGKHIRTMASLPLAEDIPIAFNSCRTGEEQHQCHNPLHALLSCTHAHFTASPERGPRVFLLLAGFPLLAGSI